MTFIIIVSLFTIITILIVIWWTWTRRATSACVQQISASKEQTIAKCTTTTNSISFAHRWKIHNFAHLYTDQCEWQSKLCSAKFSPPNNGEYSFELQLYPKKSDARYSQFVSIGMLTHEMPWQDSGRVKCELRMFVIKCDGNKLCIDHQNCDDWKEFTLIALQGKFHTDAIQYAEILDPSNKLLLNGTLTLHFDIKLTANNTVFKLLNDPFEISTSVSNCATPVAKLQHTWTIEHFSQLWSAPTDNKPPLTWIKTAYYSPFSDETNYGRFYLQLFPNGVNEFTGQYVSICTSNQNVPSGGLAHWKVLLLDVDGDVGYREEITSKVSTNRGNLININRQFLLNPANGFLDENDTLKIFCEVVYMEDAPDETRWTRPPNSCTVERSESYLDVQKYRVHYAALSWTIDRFSSYLWDKSQSTHQQIQSPIFACHTDQRIAFYAQLYPTGHCITCNGNVALFFGAILKNGADEVTVQHAVSILDQDKKKLLVKDDFVKLKQGTRGGYHQLLDLDYLAENQDTFLSNDSLNILLEVWVIQEATKIYQTDESSTTILPTISMNKSKFQNVIMNIQSSSTVGNFSVQQSPDMQASKKTYQKVKHRKRPKKINL